MTRSLHILLLGPFFYLKKNWKISLTLVFLFLFLTLFTQVGGLVVWVSLPLLDTIKIQHKAGRWAAKILFTLTLYLLTILLIVPPLASIGGRVPLPWFATRESPLEPANIGFCLLARNYVRLAVREELERIALKLSIRFPRPIMYLDANFPFFDGFPLLPHLSHKDGKKVDLVYFYRDTTTKTPLKNPPSPIGYWAYEQPKDHEIQPCKDKQSWMRWDFDWLQSAFSFAEIDPERTKALLNELVASPKIQKIFLEPHLRARFHLNPSRVRFQGCHAARHDDHIHLQIQ